MDVEAFSDNNFDSISWINNCYNSDKNIVKDAFTTSLVTKLQLYVQQVNTAVEETSQNFLINLPKVMKETQNLQAEAITLRAIMSEVQIEINQVQIETRACMENLERLDSLKTKLMNAKQGLQESDGWGRLTSELDDFLERNDLSGACDKLRILQKSLVAQIGLPGQNERESHVEDFKNRLEALASPLIVLNFSAGNVEQSKIFVQTFKEMNRLPQLTRYYRQVQKNTLERHWIELTEGAENSGSSRFLRDFYDVLLDNYTKQVKWCTQVFDLQGSIEPILVQCEILATLQPSRETAIMGALKRNCDKILVLSDISCANIYFGTMMLKNIENSGTRPSNELCKKLADAIFNYFYIFIGQYASIEQTNLNQNLTTLNLSHSTVAETIRALCTSNAKIMNWVEAAMKKCEDITQNCALSQLVIVFNVFLKTYLEKYRKAQNQLRASRMAEQDWNLLQTSISLLSCIGDLKMSVDALEKKISASVIEFGDKYNQQNEYDFCYKILGKRELTEFKRILECSKEYNKHFFTTQLNTDRQKIKGLFCSVNEILQPICTEIHDITLASIFQPIESYLKNIEVKGSTTFNTTASDLPDYSYAPQEYITQVGQYLLTLPQHLEPLLLSPSDQLKAALQICDEKYSRNMPSADILLSLISEECCAMYQEQIVQICSLTQTEAKQVATDIEYLSSVLEDLGLTLNSHLQQIAALLRAPSDNYLSLSGGCDPKLVTAVRQMRNIISKD